MTAENLSFEPQGIIAQSSITPQQKN